MISKTRHTEVTPDGKKIYIVEAHPIDIFTHKPSPEVNREFQGERMKVRFYAGIGRTTVREKAKAFSEQFGYVVKIHKDDEPWVEAKTGIQSEVFEIVDEESSYTIDEGDEDISD